MAEIGTVLGGRYRLIELLGQGGMATIYRARDNQLERDVAVKLLRPEYGRDPDFGARFRQEAQAAASLNHPGIVSVFDYGQDDAGPFIVMELIDGEDLASVIRRTGALPPRQAARLTAEIARALAAAHQRGIVHRDVKPGNVMLSRDGRVKVTDFGIARAVAEAQMTLPGTTLGSIHYFSPEQARGESATAASDIYSLGIVLYELLTGRRPWEGDSAASIAMARLSGPVPSPSAIRAGIPPALETVVRTALARDPAARFPSAAAMADALDAVVGDRAPGPGPTPTAGATAGSAGGAGPTEAAAGAAAAGAAAGGLAAAGLSDARPAGATVVTPPGAARAAGPTTVASGVARPNAARVPYGRDAYAGAEDEYADRRPRRTADDDRYDDEDRGGTSPWVWISALLALAIIAVAAFLVFRLLAGGGPAAPDQVEVPNFVGKTLDVAQQEAADAGLEVVVDRSEDRTDVPENQILSQTPGAGQLVDEDSQVRVVVAAPPGSVTVPNLADVPEQQAIDLLIDAQLRPGTRTEAFDPVIPQGNVVSQVIAAGLQVAPQTRIDYVVSKGPEPTPSPTAEPTAVPTPEVTQPPTPPPTPAPIVVGDYRCLTVLEADQQIRADGFTPIFPDGAQDTQFVSGQSPSAGAQRPPDSDVVLTVDDNVPSGC